jgi:hypothetical protein
VGEAKMKCHVITYAKAANLLVEITKHVFQRIDIAMAHQIVLPAQMNTKNVYVTKLVNTHALPEISALRD